MVLRWILLLFPLVIGVHPSMAINASKDSVFISMEPGAFHMGVGADPHTIKQGPRVIAPGEAGPHWDEAPEHEVKITKAYRISSSPVTMAEFGEFDPKYRALVESLGEKWIPASPATLITWDEAMAYCAWLGKKRGESYRLPTETEWEHAAAKLNTPVQEWCLDWWSPYVAATETDPLGPEDGVVRVIRGRSAIAHVTKRGGKPTPVRLTDRSGSVPGDRRPEVGFRLVNASAATGKCRAPESTAPALQNVSQVRADWKPAMGMSQPFFADGVEFITKPETPLTLPYWGRHHVPNLVWCDNGDLLATAFTAPTDASHQCAVLITRLRRGSDHWDAPGRFFIAPDHLVTSSGLFRAGRGELHHYNQLADDQGRRQSMIKRVSRDNGATWSAPVIVHQWPLVTASSTTWHGEPMLRPHLDLVTMNDGTLVMPTDVENAPNGGTALFISRDNGDSWNELTRFGWNHAGYAQKGGQSGWIAGRHAPFVVRKDGSFLAYGRFNDIEGHAPMSTSSDGGRTWTHDASPFPPIGSGQRSAMLQLREGPILFVSFTGRGETIMAKKSGMTFTDANGKSREGFGTFAAISEDEGQSWTHFKLIPNNSHKDPWSSHYAGYLRVTQSPDGIIHLVNSWTYWHFNLAWLRTPMPP